MSVVVNAAKAWIGTPYLHQGTHRGKGCDCLGLIRGVWREVVGDEPAKVPTYSADWAEASGREDLQTNAGLWLNDVSSQPLRSGQVLLFRMRSNAVAKHLGILAGSGPDFTFIHAYSGHGVIESPLSEPWARKIVARFEFPTEV